MHNNSETILDSLTVDKSLKCTLQCLQSKFIPLLSTKSFMTISNLDFVLIFRSHPFAFSLDGGCQCLILSGNSETESQLWMRQIRDVLWQRTLTIWSRSGKKRRFHGLYQEFYCWKLWPSIYFTGFTVSKRHFANFIGSTSFLLTIERSINAAERSNFKP